MHRLVVLTIASWKGTSLADPGFTRESLASEFATRHLHQRRSCTRGKQNELQRPPVVLRLKSPKRHRHLIVEMPRRIARDACAPAAVAFRSIRGAFKTECRVSRNPLFRMLTWKEDAILAVSLLSRLCIHVVPPIETSDRPIGRKRVDMFVTQTFPPPAGVRSRKVKKATQIGFKWGVLSALQEAASLRQIIGRRTWLLADSADRPTSR